MASSNPILHFLQSSGSMAFAGCAGCFGGLMGLLPCTVRDSTSVCWACFQMSRDDNLKPLPSKGGGPSLHDFVKERHDHVKETKKVAGADTAEGGIDVADLMLARSSVRPMKAHYETLDRNKAFASGGYGSVRRAKHKATGDIRAIKTVVKGVAGTKDYEAIANELEALVTLSHPNVLNIFEFFEEPTLLHIVMELCEGGDFHSIVYPKLPALEVAALFRDVFLGVAYCHAHNVCHRDLKLENCLITVGRNCRIGKVIDFGLAALRRDNGTKEAWLYGTLGTKYFVAPEVLNRHIAYTNKCDCWSLGVMIYIVCTNEHPFAAQAHRLKNSDLFRAVASSPLRQEPLLRHSTPAPAVAMIKGLLMRDQKHRWSAEEALKQPWLNPPPAAKAATTSTQPLALPGAGRFLETWREVTPLQKLIVTIEAHQEHIKTVDEMRSVFSALDTDGQGSLSKEELQEGLKKGGWRLDEAALENMFKGLDNNHDGEINYLEWISATLQPQLIDSTRNMREVFDWFDEDGNGFISSEELSSVLSSIEGGAEQLLEFDANSDNKLDWKEFQQFMHKLAKQRVF